MPTYHYKCSSCGDESDIYSSIDERDKERICEKCNEGSLTREVELELNVVDQTTDYYRRKKVLEKEISRIKNDAALARELDIASARDYQ